MKSSFFLSLSVSLSLSLSLSLARARAHPRYSDTVMKTYVVNVSSVVRALWSVVEKMIDPVTREGIAFLGADGAATAARLRADGVPLSAVPAYLGADAAATGRGVWRLLVSSRAAAADPRWRMRRQRASVSCVWVAVASISRARMAVRRREEASSPPLTRRPNAPAGRRRDGARQMATTA